MENVNERKKHFLLFVISLLIVNTFLLSFQLGLFEESNLDGAATQATTDLSINVFLFESVLVPSSGNITATDAIVKSILPKISGLTPGWLANLSVHGESYPTNWAEAEPTLSEVGTARLEYFEIVINDSTIGGSYDIYFNVSQSALVNITSDDVRLFIYDSGWTALPTTILNGSSVPAQFYGTSAHFSKFLIAEAAPPTSSLPHSTTSGGAGGGALLVKDFSLEPLTISISLKQGEVKSASFTIKNTGLKAIENVVVSTTLDDIIHIKENSFSLSLKEEKVISIDIIARETTTPNFYLGKIYVKADREIKEILVAIEVESKGPLFDVKTNIPKQFLETYPGGDVLAEITIFSIERVGLVDVTVEYQIRDSEDNIIIEESEMLAVETQTKFTKTITIPKDTLLGDYVWYTRVLYGQKLASSTAMFKVIGKRALIGEAFLADFKEILFDYTVYWISFVAVLFVIIFVIIILRKRRPERRVKSRHKVKKIKKKENKREPFCRPWKKEKIPHKSKRRSSFSDTFREELVKRDEAHKKHEKMMREELAREKKSHQEHQKKVERILQRKKGVKKKAAPRKSEKKKLLSSK